jgi:hypothetical protein
VLVVYEGGDLELTFALHGLFAFTLSLHFLDDSTSTIFRT